MKGTVITTLDLSNNLLSRPISFIAGLASSIQHLKVSHNGFTGEASDFADFAWLILLSLDHNMIIGVVPKISAPPPVINIVTFGTYTRASPEFGRNATDAAGGSRRKLRRPIGDRRSAGGLLPPSPRWVRMMRRSPDWRHCDHDAGSRDQSVALNLNGSLSSHWDRCHSLKR
ncbi:hypothetical protein ZWY2020_051003 [Hordeum vulgare]|nr:hypothetical protein ZWY2020_051003 [Hordeum vulgare]